MRLKRYIGRYTVTIPWECFHNKQLSSPSMPFSLLALPSLGSLETGRLLDHLQIQAGLGRPFSFSSGGFKMLNLEWDVYQWGVSNININFISMVWYAYIYKLWYSLCIVFRDEAVRHLCVLQGRKAGSQEGHVRAFLVRFLPEGRVRMLCPPVNALSVVLLWLKGV